MPTFVAVDCHISTLPCLGIGGIGIEYLNSSNLDTYTTGLSADDFQNKLANLGYLGGDEAQFQSDLNAGNVITISAFQAASTTYP